MALPAGRYGVTKNQLLKIKKLPMNTIKLIEELTEKFNLLGTAAFKNSTSVVTDSSDLVESGAVKDIVGWGNDNVDIPTPFVNGVLSWDDSADNIVTNSLYITSPYIPIREDVITISATKGDIVRIYYTDENHNKLYFVGNVPVDGDALTIPKKDGAKYIRFSIGGLGTVTYTDYGTKLKANIVYGSEPYHASVEESLEQKTDNSVIGTVEDGTTASQAYAVGSHAIRNGKFITWKNAKAQDETINDVSDYTSGDVAGCLLKKKTVTGAVSSSGSIEIDSNVIAVACAYCTTDGNIICMPFIYDNRTYLHLRKRTVGSWDAVESGTVTIDVYYFD